MMRLDASISILLSPRGLVAESPMARRMRTFSAEEKLMTVRQFVVGILMATCLFGTTMVPPGGGQAPDAKVRSAMDILESMAEKLGPPKIEGTDTVAGKKVPAIYFGSTKMNNNVDLVDEVAKQAGGTATIFVKSGDEFVRVATNVKKDDGSRAIGTVLDPKGKAIQAIRNNEAF
jgi:hypothetical protein